MVMMNIRSFHKFVPIFLIAEPFQFANNIWAQDNKIYINIGDYEVNCEYVNTDTRVVQS